MPLSSFSGENTRWLSTIAWISSSEPAESQCSGSSFTRSCAPGTASGRSRSGWMAFSRSNGSGLASLSFAGRPSAFFASAGSGSTSGRPSRSCVVVASSSTLSRVSHRVASPSATSVPPASTQLRSFVTTPGPMASP